MNQPAVAAGPDFRGTQGRGGDGKDHTVATFACVLHSHRAFELFLWRLARVAGEVGANGLPVKSAVESLHHILSPEKQRAGLDFGEKQDRCPGIAILALGDLLTESRHGPGCDLLALAGAAVEAAYRAVGSRTIDDVGVGWIGGDVAAFASPNTEPVAPIDVAVVGAAGQARGAAVLLRTEDVVWELTIGNDVVELARRLVVPSAPGGAAIQRYGCALIGGEDHARGIGWIDPKLVIIVAAGR